MTHRSRCRKGSTPDIERGTLGGREVTGKCGFWSSLSEESVDGVVVLAR
jgi:hypothetical protein